MKTATQTKPAIGWLCSPCAVAGLELLVLVAVLEWVLWTDNKRVLGELARGCGVAVAALVTLTLLWRQRPTLGECAWGRNRGWDGVAWLAAWTFASFAGLAFVGWRAGTLGAAEFIGSWLAGNWIMDGVQQVLLQWILVPRLTILTDRRGPIVSAAAALLFCLLHAPNLLLMLLTLVAGFVWCEWYRRYRSFPALWMSHIILAFATLYCLDGPSLLRLRVGVSYWLHSVNYS